MNSSANELPHAVLEQAAEWYAVIRCGKASAQETSRWRAWLAASNDHRAAWEQVELISQSFTPLQQTRDPHQTIKSLHAADQRIRQRRRALLGIVAVAGTGMLTWAGWHQRLLPNTVLALAADFRTATGEQREITLTDGTHIWLNTASAIDVEYDDTIRRIVLLAGEIYIQTAKDDARRPFIVDSAQGRMRALGTRFNVRVGDGNTHIAVHEGSVEVRLVQALSSAVIEAGWQTDFTSDFIAPSMPADEMYAAWTRGIFIANDIPLRDVVQELRRYRKGHLGLHDDIADLKVYGNLPLHDTDRALKMITGALPVQVRETFPWWVSLEPRQ